jgi:hypothetical protein
LATLNEQTPASTWQITCIGATCTCQQQRKEPFMRAISPQFSFPTTSQDVFETAKHIQLETDFTEQVSQIAGWYCRQVVQIFPKQELILFLLTASARRHVWFAVIAQMTEIHDPQDLQHELLTTSSKELIQNAYGSVPPGFLKILAKLPAKAKSRRFYKHLHQLLSQTPGLATSLANTILDENFIDLLIHLPPDHKDIKVANAFSSTENFDAFKAICDAFNDQEPNFLNTALSLIKNNTSLERLFYRFYEEIAFAEPVLPKHPQLMYIHDGRAMCKVARSWENCLAQYVEEALRNEVQYYIFTTESGEEILFAMKNDHPFGWYQNEVKTKSNDSPDLEQQVELDDFLKSVGFARTESVNYLMKSLVMGCGRARQRRERANTKSGIIPTKSIG